MDEQNPRVGAERLSGRGDDQVAGRAGAGDYTASSAGAGAPGPSGETARGYVASPASANETDQRTREIRREIEQTREDMSETVNAIQDRLSPRSIAANAADSVRTSASEKAREIADSEPVHYVRANPIPTAMVGVGIAGLAWLVLGGREARTSRRDSYRRGTRDWRVGPRYYEGEEYARATYRPRYGYGDESAEVYPPTPSSGSDAGRSSGERASSWTGGISSRAGEMADDVSRRARRTTARTRTQLQRTWNDNPLLMGAAAAVAGAIVGLAVPETDREDEWMGETRDDMIEGVQQAVRDKVEAVQETAASALDQVKSVVGIPDESNNEAGTAGTTATGRARKRGGPSSAGDIGNS